MEENSLFKPTRLGPLSLANCTVMSPMTRNRCAEVLAPSASAAEGQIFTDAQGMQDYPTAT